MTKNDFLCSIEGYDVATFEILANNKWITGNIDKIMESSVRIICRETNKPRTIMYEDIRDVVISDEITVPQSKTQPENDPVDSSNISSLISITANRITEKKLDLQDRHETIKKGMKDRGMSAKWNSVNSSFMDAQKNHCLEEKSERLIDTLDDLYAKYPIAEIKMQLGQIFYKLEEYDNAAIEFEKGMDYYNAAVCALLDSDKNYAFHMIAKTILTAESITKDIVVNFFVYAAKTRQGAICADIVSKLDFDNAVYSAFLDEFFYGIIFMIDTYGMTSKIPSALQSPSKKSIQALQALLTTITANESFSPIVLSEKTEALQPVEVDEFSGKQTGTITWYNCTNGCGKIDNTLFFYICQVEDETLREKLCRGEIRTVKVSYSLGEGVKGIAADHITPLEDLELLTASNQKDVIHSGIIWDYTSHEEFGHIGEGNMCYNFRKSEVIDPYLLKYMDEAFRISDLQVDFVSNTINGKKCVSKMWLSDCDENKQIISQYEGQISQAEKKQFKTELAMAKGEISPVYNTYNYISLKPWVEPTIPGTDNRNSEYAPSIPTVPQNIQHFNSRVNSPFQMGSKIMLTKSASPKELERAEQYFLQAIEQNDQVGPSVNNLINLYIRSGDPVQMDKAFEYLERYKTAVGEEKYRNAKIQLLDKKKDYAQLCEYLESVIPRTYKANTKLHYIHKLALAYSKHGDYDNAIKWFEQWKKVRSSSKIQLGAAAFNPSMEITINRGLAIAYYLKGDRTTATSMAEALLKRNSDDTIAQQIIAGTYVNSVISKKESQHFESDYDDEYDSEQENSDIPEYVRNQIESIQFSEQFAKKAINKHIRDNTYVGSADEAARDIDSYLGAINSMTFEARSKAWLALAKIVQQFLNQKNFSEGDKKKYKLTPKRMKVFIGCSLSVSGDAAIQRQQQMIDTARYFYLMAIKILYPKNSYYIHSQELMINSFFLSENDLVRKTSETNSGKSNSIKFPDIANLRLLSIKDLLLMSFLLPENNGLSRNMVNAIYENPKLQSIAVEELQRIVDDPSVNTRIMDSYAFFDLWRNAKREYELTFKELQDTLSKVASEKQTVGQLMNCREKIESILGKKVMFNTDERYISYFLKIIENCMRLNDMSIFDDNVDVYEGIISDCENLLREIQDAPTKLSYENLRPCCIDMLSVSQNKLNKLYKDSPPNLIVTPVPVTYRFDGNVGRVTIIVENKDDVQTANISNIKVTGYQNNVVQQGNVISNITSVKGGQRKEYVLDMKFTENEIERTTFDIHVEFSYSYYAQHNDMITGSFEDKFSINLYRKEDFHAIEVNPFDRYKEGAAVDDDAMFKGRSKDIERITKMLKSDDGKMMKHRGIYMFGQKRTGKSSIMAHLTKSIEEAYPDQYIIIDVGSVGKIPQNERFENSLKSKLISSIKTTLRRKYRSLYNTLNVNGDFFDKTIRQIESADGFTSSFDIAMDEICDILDGKILMFLIDEYTYIYEGIENGLIRKDFPHFWKAFLQENDVCSIVIGMDNMKKFVSLYQNDFASMVDYEVTYLDREGAIDLISTPILDENEKTRFDEEALDYIFTLTHGSAYLIMVLCAKLVDYMNETCTAHISRTTVETFIHKKWLADSMYDFDKLFDPQLNDPSIFGDQNNRTTNDNKIILTYIANHCNTANRIRISEIKCSGSLSTPTDAYQEQLIRQLNNRHVIEINSGSCMIQVDLLRLYLKQKEGLK